MKILGIETSCDETAAAVVESGSRILSNIVFSQIALHQKTGGIVPEVAAREHAVKIIPVIDAALRKAKTKLYDIDAIAVTKGPGLQISLLIGTNAGQTLALVAKKPLIPVHHIEGHMYANFARKLPKFPIMVLTASGGHNELILWKGHGDYKFLGSTRDDAAGEAFDKVARLLGLPYPGGPHIEKLAKRGDPKQYPLPIPFPQSFDFSFSGIKTAVLYFLRDFPKKYRGKKITQKVKADLAASFQYAVVEALSEKLMRAAKKHAVKEIHLAGGVSANKYLQNIVREKMRKEGLKIPLRFPPIQLCTDNAAMIAIAGYHRIKKNPHQYRKWKPLIPDPNLPIRKW